MKELKKQETRIHWWIALKSLSPDSSLIVFSNLNECLVRPLNISNTSLEVVCVTEYSRVLSCNETIEELHLVSSPLGPNGIELLSNALCTNTVLKGMWLTDDDTIKDQDIAHISNMLSANTILKDLRLNCPNITEFGEQQLSEVLTNNETLTTLYINGHRLC